MLRITAFFRASTAAQFRLSRLNAGDAEIVGLFQVIPKLCIKQQRFGRNAAHVEARPAQLRACVNKSDFQPVFCSANRRRIPGGPPPITATS